MYAKDKETIVDRREMLRVKVKSLMAEARIIRAEERRTFGVLQHELWSHRTNELRREARASHIAYGLIRGLTMEQMERKSYTKPDQARVDAMVKKYGPKQPKPEAPAIPAPTAIKRVLMPA